jgi:hypothetical protein
MRTLFSRLFKWEKPTDNVSSHALSHLIEAGAFPFVDLCPWLKAEGKDLLAAIDNLGHHLAITQTYVILTFSKMPSSVAASNFRHAFGYADRDRFWDKVGILHLVYYHGWCSIRIPCFYSGQVRYMMKPDLFYAVLDIPLWILLLTIQTVIDTHLCFATETRISACHYIKTRVEHILHLTGIDILLTKAKQDLQETQREVRNKFNSKQLPSTVKTRAGISIASSKLVVCIDNTFLSLSHHSHC